MGRNARRRGGGSAGGAVGGAVHEQERIEEGTGVDRLSSLLVTGTAVDGQDRALGDLVDAVLQERRARVAVAETVAAARASGVSWEAIALVLGLTRQGAQKRYGGSS